MLVENMLSARLRVALDASQNSSQALDRKKKFQYTTFLYVNDERSILSYGVVKLRAIGKRSALREA